MTESNFFTQVGALVGAEIKSARTFAAAQAASAQSTAISTIRANVDAAGDTLAKQYALIQAINAILTSDDLTLDTVQELVTYIKANRELIDGVLADKLDKASIVAGLTSTDDSKVLAASQGKVISDLLNALSGRITTLEGATDGRVGSLSDLTTSAKTTTVAAINELNTAVVAIGTYSDFEAAFTTAAA